MAHSDLSTVSDALRRTLGYFSSESGADVDADPAGGPSATGSAPPTGRRSRCAATNLFFSLSADAELRLEPMAIDLLAHRLQVDANSLLQVSRIPARTFHRRQAEGKSLSGTETDRVLRIARVASLAERVFEDADKARRWLSKDHRLLGAKPLDLLASDQGTHEVEAELHRIEWGDFA